MAGRSRPERSCRAVRENIAAVVRLEEEALARRKSADRIADLIGGFTGSLAFIVLHVAVFTVYIGWNSDLIPGLQPFDRFPFLLLGMGVSMEAIFLSTFVLMKQNRMSRRADQRAHLDLQINLLSEREMTLVLRVLYRMSLELGVQLREDEIKELIEHTPVEALASELEEKIPEQ